MYTPVSKGAMVMSLQTWKDEYYSVDATESIDTPLIAAQHSLKKWRGLTKENLEKHGLVKEGESREIWNGWGDRFSVDEESCALCVMVDSWCKECPLCQLGYGCKDDQEYGMWYYHDDPLPMITALEELVDKLENTPEEVDYSDPGWDE
jgi:hypothetical protein